MANFKACQERNCDCPSDEYVKLEALHIDSTENDMILKLKAKKGMKFLEDEVKKCVD
jgi:hypothetical protein